MALGFGQALFAGNPSAAVEGPRTIVVKPREWKADRIHVEILTLEGETIISQQVRTTERSRKYNLRNLPAGQYMLRMSDDLKVLSQNFALDHEGIVLSEEIAVDFKPVINNTENHLDVNFFTRGRASTVSILDGENNVVYSENFDKPAIHKRFDISRFEKGTYTVLCEVAGKTHVSGFTK